MFKDRMTRWRTKNGYALQWWIYIDKFWTRSPSTRPNILHIHSVFRKFWSKERMLPKFGKPVYRKRQKWHWRIQGGARDAAVYRGSKFFHFHAVKDQNFLYFMLIFRDTKLYVEALEVLSSPPPRARILDSRLVTLYMNLPNEFLSSGRHLKKL